MTDTSTNSILDDAVLGALSRFGTTGDDGLRAIDCRDVAAIDDQGLLGVLANATADGQVALAGEALTMLDVLLERSTTEAVALESRAAAALVMLDDLNIETRLLKGLAVAHVDYPDPELRHYGDVDLLIRGTDVARAVTAFEQHGFRRHFAEPFDGFDEGVGKGVAVGDDTRTVFDLHRTLALGYYGTRLPVDDLWTNAERFELAGAAAMAMPPERRFVHAALHLALDPHPRMANGLDLVVIAGSHPGLTASDIVGVAQHWGCLHPLAIALETTFDWFGTAWAPPDLVEWVAAHQPRVVDRLMIATFHGRFASSHLRSLGAVLGLRSGTDRMRALRGAITRGHHERE